MAEVLLSIRAKGVRAGGKTLIRGLDLDLHPGQIIVMGGPSGCGKTTFLRGVAMLDDALRGDVLFEGQSPMETGWTAYRRAVNYVSQMPVLLEGTVWENLLRPFEYAISGSRPRRGPVVAALERLKIEEKRLKQPAESLSVGERQRVCLLRSMLTCPRVYLLDEPTSALDRKTARSVLEVLRQDLDERNAAALVVSHDAEAIEQWADKAVDLRPYLDLEGLGVGS